MSRIIVTLAVCFLAATASAEEPPQLRGLRRAYNKLQHPSEAQRIAYVTLLVRLRESFTRKDDAALDAIDSEVVSHPMRASANARELSKRLVGRWQSPRHAYFFHADGTWSGDDDTPVDTGGTWRIEGNQFFENFRYQTPASGETLILLTATDLVFGTHEGPYYLRRGKVFPWH